MISIPENEFRRLLNDIQAYLDNPRSAPSMMAKIAIGTLRMYDVGYFYSAPEKKNGMD